MTKVRLDITMSLDGYVAGPDPTLEEPLGRGGDQLHDWAFKLAAWRAPHGLEGGEVNASSAVMEAGRAPPGAGVIGPRMYSGGARARGAPPQPRGPWGGGPPLPPPPLVP